MIVNIQKSKKLKSYNDGKIAAFMFINDFNLYKKKNKHLIFSSKRLLPLKESLNYCTKIKFITI